MLRGRRKQFRRSAALPSRLNPSMTAEATATPEAFLSTQPHAIVERDGVRYTLLGTAHVSRASVDAVKEAVGSGRFDAVAFLGATARFGAAFGAAFFVFVTAFFATDFFVAAFFAICLITPMPRFPKCHPTGAPPPPAASSVATAPV